ncbi:hypothetical protein Cva_00130 [Caedimonas varicaedens]|uniref:DUF29 domain-containing protein n=1 Tax=Caedimonas varicaedens TaxID=1629334 RepID=A0A0K8MBE5_9PROT|nr:hypothetical protein Cva_00130 [Caedimonas varicaedens]
MSSRYETDYYGWVKEQAELLATKRFEELDLPMLEEEILSLAWNQKKYVEYHLKSLIFYLLLWQFQPYWRGREWKGAMSLLRLDLQHELEDNKTLKDNIQDSIKDCYRTSLYRAQRAMGHEDLPAQCPYTFDQIMNDTFYPE